MLPMLLRIKIKSDEANFGFYLPLIILYILLLPLYILISLVYLIMILAGECAKEARSYLKIAFYAPRLIKAAKSTEIEVHSGKSDVLIYIK